MTDRDEIERLILRYAELFDLGDVEGCSHLFDNGVMTSTFDGMTRDAAAFREQHATYTIRYGDGTPQTSHLITNIIIDVAPDRQTATSSSYVTVLQATEALPLQAIYSGSYYDRFHRVGDVWQFAERTSFARLRGDQTHHQRPKAG